MISGIFGEIGELFFEIEVVAADGNQFPIVTLLDTGFTTGWLGMDIQDKCLDKIIYSHCERNEMKRSNPKSL